MTKDETIARLAKLKADEEPPKYGTSFKEFSNMYEMALYEAALKYGVDPDSVYFYYEIEDGKGKKW